MMGKFGASLSDSSDNHLTFIKQWHILGSFMSFFEPGGMDANSSFTSNISLYETEPGTVKITAMTISESPSLWFGGRDKVFIVYPPFFNRFMEELKAIGGEPVDIQPIAKAAKDATPKP
jgi:hypothetical protein